MFEAIRHIIVVGDNLSNIEKKIEKHTNRVVEINEIITTLREKEVVNFEKIDKRKKEVYKHIKLAKEWKQWKSKVLEELETLNKLECDENIVAEKALLTDIANINIVADCRSCINHESLDHCPFGLEVVDGKCDYFC